MGWGQIKIEQSLAKCSFISARIFMFSSSNIICIGPKGSFSPGVQKFYRGNHKNCPQNGVSGNTGRVCTRKAKSNGPGGRLWSGDSGPVAVGLVPVCRTTRHANVQVAISSGEHVFRISLWRPNCLRSTSFKSSKKIVFLLKAEIATTPSG